MNAPCDWNIQCKSEQETNECRYNETNEVEHKMSQLKDAQQNQEK